MVSEKAEVAENLYKTNGKLWFRKGNCDGAGREKRDKVGKEKGDQAENLIYPLEKLIKPMEN